MLARAGVGRYITWACSEDASGEHHSSSHIQQDKEADNPK